MTCYDLWLLYHNYGLLDDFDSQILSGSIVLVIITFNNSDIWVIGMQNNHMNIRKIYFWDVIFVSKRDINRSKSYDWLLNELNDIYQLPHSNIVSLFRSIGDCIILTENSLWLLYHVEILCLNRHIKSQDWVANFVI